MKRAFKFSKAGEELFTKWDTRLGNEEEHIYYLLAGLKDTGWIPPRAFDFLLRKGLLEEDKAAELIEQALGEEVSNKEKYIVPECELTEESIQLMERAKKDYSSLTQGELEVVRVLYAYCNPYIRSSIYPWIILGFIDEGRLKPRKEEEDGD